MKILRATFLSVFLLLPSMPLLAGADTAANVSSVNINTADASVIAKVLKGVGESKAKAIIDKNEIPKRVTRFNQQKVAIKGYMLPLRVQDGKITELLILRDQSMCCYGAVPRINEWVSVRMPEGKGVKPVLEVPITFFGTLRVGEVLENGYLVGIYEMDGERLGGPIDL